MSADEEIVIDLTYLPGPEQKGLRPVVRSLGRLARDFREDGGPPPLPRPVVGRVEGGDLPLFYPGLNGVTGVPGSGKSLLLKFLARQVIRDDPDACVLVLDCETSEEEYAATMVGDLRMEEAELNRLFYVTDDPRQVPRRERWSGEADRLEDVLDGPGGAPSMVLIDSQSKSMAKQGLDENRALDCTTWYEAVAVPVADRWPDAAVVMIQGRQKGWAPNMDVRQGRGSSALLHEVDAQYMLWTKTQGSRDVDGVVEVKCTKCRYGHRVENTVAAHWHYGPSGFGLTLPEGTVEEDLPDPEVVERVVLAYFASDPRDHDRPGLPPKPEQALATIAADLGVSSAAGRARVAEGLDALVASGEVRRGQPSQPGVPGVRPVRVWSASADPGWDS